MSDPTRTPGMILPPSMTPPSGAFSPPSGAFGPPEPLTPYQQELRGVYQENVEEEESSRNWLRPLQKVLDVLQRGQYVSANVADSLIQAAQGKGLDERQSFFEAIRTGATGEVKGSYSDVIRDTLGRGEKKLFANAPEGKRRAQWDWADVLGFTADILLDPLTYMGFGGASKGATKAASEFADDSVRMFLRQMSRDPTELARLTRGRISPQEVVGELAEGTQKAIQRLQAKGGDLGRVIDETYKTAYRQGLRQTQENLIRASREALGEIDEPVGGFAQIGLDDIAQRLEAGTAYQGGGTVYGSRFMTKEFEGLPFVSRRGARAESGITSIRRDTWDKFSNLFKSSRLGSAVSDGIWGVMHKGPVGEIRRSLGFRDPYQKYLRAKELNAMKTGEIAQTDAAMELLQPLRDLDESQVKELYRVMAKREDLAAQATGSADRLFDLGQSADDAVNQAAKNLEQSLQKMKGYEDFWAQRLGESVADSMDYYLPKVQRFRQSSQNVRRPRKYTFSESVEREKELLKFIYGTDDEQFIQRLIDSNTTGVGVDIREAMVERAMLHGRMQGRYNLFEQIKEMGIDLRDNLDPAAAGLKTGGRSINELGMKTVDHDALAGFVFDNDVASIADRAIKITGKDRNIFQRAMAKYANWWKGVVLATTGYHGRNFMTNTMIQFLHHGPRAFNKNEIMESAAAVWYALKKSDPKMNLDEFLTRVGLDEDAMGKILNHRKGNLTVRELADEAINRNVISQSTMGYDAQTVLQRFKGEGSGQPIRSASRQVGNYVENIPRFQSFMIDYMDNATADLSKLRPDMRLADIEKPALDFAGLEAKKYFLDYEDLTDFEQGFLKNVIPFYCVPEEAEILSRDGWKTYHELEVGEEVLTYNKEKDLQEWQPVKEIATFRFDGELKHLTGKYMDFLCTDDHRWPIEKPKSKVRGKNYGGGREIVRAYDLKKTDRFILSAETEDQKTLWSARDAAILGWLVTDGYMRVRGNYLEAMIYQKKKEECQIIKALLGDFCTSVSEHPDTGVLCFHISSKWTNRIKDSVKTKADIPKIATRLSQDAAQAMWISMVKAEGTIGKSNIQFCQRPGPILDTFQILSQILNRPFSYRVREPQGWSKHPVGYGYVRNGNRIQGNYVKHRTSEYHGTIWCPKTENGTWVMRQNGQTIITGNTFLRKNLGAQLSALTLYPEMYSLIPKIEEFIEYEDPDYDPSMVPEWMRNEGMFPVMQTGENEYRFFRPDFAYNDLNLIPLQWEEGNVLPNWNGEELKDQLINATAPWIRFMTNKLIQSDTPYQFFYQEYMNPTEEAPYLMRLFASHPEVVPFVDGLLKMAGYEEGAKISERDGKLEIDSNMAYLMQEFLPVLRQGAYLFYLADEIPFVDNVIKNHLKVEDEYEGAEEVLQNLSFWLGIKLRDQDLEQEKERIATDLYYRSVEELNEQRRDRPGAEQRRLESRQNRDELIRRLQ